MNLKQLILVILSMVSLSLFAQDTYYYFKGQRIPLTTDPTRVNVITLSSYSTQGGAAFMPAAVPTGIQVESSITGELYNMSLLKVSESNVSLLNTYINATINSNYNIALPCYINRYGAELATTNKIYVKLHQTSDLSILRSLISQYNLTFLRQDEDIPLWCIISITQQTPLKTVEMANVLFESGAFSVVTPEFRFYIRKNNISWDENVSEQWGLYNAENDSIDINASSAWNYATGRGVKIGILDEGVDWQHDDLKENMYNLYCYDAMSGLPLRALYGDHGTHVIGIAAATKNNGKFIAGVAPDATIVSASMSYDGVSPEQVYQAMIRLCKAGSDVINCSWGCYYEDEFLNDAIDYVIENGRGGKGCILIFSTGNSNECSVSYPSGYRPEILAVGAIDKFGFRFYEELILNEQKFIFGSNYGVALDVVAPGVDILSTLPNQKTGYNTGTSMAAPYVSGVAALILELNPDLTAQQVRDIIEQSTIKVGLRDKEGEYETHSNRPNGTWNKYYGYGLVDALKAVQNTPRKEIDY